MTTPLPAMFTTDRLEIRPVPLDAVQAIETGRRLPDWVDDFPQAGDVAIARLMRADDPRQSSTVDGLWGHHQIVESSSALVVGGIGFFGPPENGVAEIGYGIVPSRQRNGYATEAVTAVLSVAWSDPGLLAVIATTDGTNIPSHRVLIKTGFMLEPGETGWRYRITRRSRPR